MKNRSALATCIALTLTAGLARAESQAESYKREACAYLGHSLASPEGAADCARAEYWAALENRGIENADDVAYEAVETSEPMPRRLALAWIDLRSHPEEGMGWACWVEPVATPAGARWLGVCVDR